jgi:hypothetical protein
MKRPVRYLRRGVYELAHLSLAAALALTIIVFLGSIVQPFFSDVFGVWLGWMIFAITFFVAIAFIGWKDPS